MKQILIVEDDPGIREALKEVLELENYQIVTAGNGEEALVMLNKGVSPHLILLDLMMPVMNGREFLQKMDTVNEWKGYPVVLFSAAGNVSGIESKRLVLKKPIDLDELLEVVENNCR